MPSRAHPAGDRRAALGAVLAGGMSTRMGTPKASLELAGRPLAAYAVEAVEAAGLVPAVVAKDDSELPALGCRVIREADPRSHPAAGILAALGVAGGPVVVVACDMPFVAPQLIGVLAQVAAPVAIPLIDGRLQPLLARYAPVVTPALERAVDRGEPLRDVVRALDPHVLGHDELAGFGDPSLLALNVNDRADLEAAERLVTATPSR